MTDGSDKKHQKRRNVSIVVVALALAVTGGILAYMLPVFTSKSPKEAIIIVPDEGSMEQLADSLERHTNKRFASLTMRMAGMMRSAFHLRPGAYRLSPGQSAFSAARLLGRGQQYIVNISLNNIRTREELAGKVSRHLRFSQRELLDALADPKTTEPYGLTPENAMALFIADNYEVYWNTSARDFIKKIGKRYSSFWNEKRRVQARDLGLSPVQAAVIASIADEETNKKDEKGRICRLYLNRYKKGMRLQADPTVKFAIGDFSIKRVNKTHLSFDSPYNTYRSSGLPPGPIRISNPATIDALLNSSPTSDIYMCARSDFSGYHDFTSSYSEHQANARRYQEKLNQMGI